MNNKNGVILPLSLVVLGISPFQQSIAQGRGQIEEVIVTANKREQNLQDVPMAISAFSGEQLENYQIGNIEDLTKLVPSLKYVEADQPSHASLSIRGVGSFVSSPALEAGVAVVVDEVPIARTEMTSFEYSDVERIEVLRGPQGTLFGKNATAGLIHVISRDPSPEFEASLAANYENPSDLPGYNGKVSFNASGPVTEDIGVRFSGFYRKEAGPYVDAAFDDEVLPVNTSLGGRLKLVWDASDAVSVRLTLEHQDFDGQSSPVTFSSATEEKQSKSSVRFHDENNRTETFGNNKSVLINSGMGLIVNWDIGDLLLTSVTGYRDFKNRNRLGIPKFTGERLSVDLNGVRDIDTFTQEFRITSTGARTIDYSAGILWFDNEIDDREFGAVTDIPTEVIITGTAPGVPLLVDLEGLGAVPGEGLDQVADQNSNIGTENLGVYGQLTWNISDAWHLTGGARYIDEKVTVSTRKKQAIQQDTTGAPVSESDVMIAPTSVIDEAVIGAMSLSHDWSDDITLYTTVSTGYRGRAFDLNATELEEAVANPVEPETSFNTEFGIKSRLFDNSLELNMTVFRTVFSNFQSQISRLEVSGGVPTYKNRIESAGELETRGVEVDFQARPLEALTLFGSILYNPTEFNEYTTSCFPGQQPGEDGGEDLNDDGACDQQDVTGEPLGGAPEHSVAVVARYDTPFYGGMGFAQLGGRWQSETEPNNRHPNLTIDAYSVFDLNLGWRGFDNRFEAVFYVKNIFDEFYVVSKTGLTATNSREDVAHFFPRDANRTFGVSLGYEW